MNESKDAPQKSDTALNEEKILKFWAENDIFQKTLKKPATEGDFVFYEGPPTANGKPGIHHLIARAFKDVIPRYKTMRGFHVDRKGGWDTHGLPVEIQVEKQLGLKSKKEVEAYGVEKFNQECKKSVWEYVDLWNDFTSRIGYWVDQENPYITYEKTYMESVWNILKKVSEKKAGGVLGMGGKEMLYKDYKVLPWCPRCGTALSSHELAQGYEDVKDLSVYVKFKVVGQENTYLLAWTTTPWTLPGNVALAVGEEVQYAEVESENLKYFLAEKLVEKVFAGKENYKIIKKFSGKNLVGLEYEPLYPYLSQKFGDKNPEAFARAYKVYPADFVTTEDGTGIVHTAVMYGQDDFELGTKMELPKFHLVQEDGHFLPDMDFLSGRFVKEKDEKGEDTLAIDIIKDLAARSLLFKKEKYAHTYPHCWRCKTPLIYYARDSWYIRMSDLRAQLVKENKEISWHPEHIRDGRFGEWLSEVKDWAISRERYWGTPLPFWTNEKGELTVIGSVAELKAHIPQRNKYTLVRHGQSESNARGHRISTDIEKHDPLSELGREQVEKTAKDLAGRQIDVILTSPFMRARETAEIIAKQIGFKGQIVALEGLRELNLGHWEGKTWEEYMSQFKNMLERFTKHPGFEVDGIENWEDARRRMAKCFYEIDAKYEGKNILVIGHGGPLSLLALASQGYSIKEIAQHYSDEWFANAEIKEIDWRNLPHNEKFEIDLHRPYIDQVELMDKEGNKLTRVKEVLDVWFDSGAMPFAQVHYPFEKEQGLKYPADYISEAIDQTRGWFYTLHAIGTLMGMGKAYKNVICLTHILDAQGKKMSKSVGNVVDPWVMMDKYGVDALRLWMFTVNQPGDSKNFDEKTVDEVVKKVFNLLTNIISFYEMYADENVVASADSKNVLDKWLTTRLHQMISEGTNALDEYDVFSAGRAIRDFVGDFSTWYIRRSRDRFKSDDAIDKANALSTTKYVLLELAKYMAPFTPFYAEIMYQKVGGQLESVHLENWAEPEVKSVGDVVVLEDMQEVRTLSSVGLELRSKANIKVRQPISKITVKSTRIQGRDDLVALLKDELNVKEVSFDASLATDAEIDTNISEELRLEGQMREVVRAVQDLRKKENFTVGDTVRLFVDTNEKGKKFMQAFSEEISRLTLLNEIVYKEVSGEKISVDDLEFVFGLEKI